MDYQNPIDPKAGILCMFSGGIDSCSALYRLLYNPEYIDNPIVVHHINLINRENRARAEGVAMSSILKFFKKNAPKSFLYTESTFDTMGFAPLHSEKFPYDMDTVAFIAGNICRARDSIKYIATGRNQTDNKEGGENYQKRIRKYKGILKSMLELENSNAQFFYPMLDVTKEQAFKLLPPEIQDSVWWCRRPVYDENKNAHPCKKCVTCLKVNEFHPFI